MICARRKSKRSMISLAARTAARCFTSRRRPRSLTTGRLPLILRWRQRRQPGLNVKVERAVWPAPVFCFPQLHFHFATYLGGPQRRHSAAKRFPTVTINRQRVVQDRSWTTFVTVNRAPQAQRAYRPAGISYVSETSIPKLRIENSGLLAPSRSSGSIPRQITQRRQSAFFSATVQLNTRREELTQTFKAQRRIREHPPRVLSSRSQRPEVLAFADPSQPARIQFDRPEELVWRRTAPAATVTEDVHHANLPDSAQRAPVRTSAVETPAQSISQASSQAAPQQITKLDPAFVDRLTDDVIRRVEQRSRIERQRRGL